jgi:hypothetical protein
MASRAIEVVYRTLKSDDGDRDEIIGKIADTSKVAIGVLLEGTGQWETASDLAWLTTQLLIFVKAEGWAQFPEVRDTIKRWWDTENVLMPIDLEERFEDVVRRYRPTNNVHQLFPMTTPKVNTGKKTQSPEAAKARVMRDAKRAANRAERLKQQRGIDASNDAGKSKGGKKVAGKKK